MDTNPTQLVVFVGAVLLMFAIGRVGKLRAERRGAARALRQPPSPSSPAEQGANSEPAESTRS
jgi:hypothetical protein